MFTGIVEETAVVRSILKDSDTMVLTLQAPKITEDIKIGDSISVNGVCLTVTGFSEDAFTVDVMPETMYASSLNVLEEGARANVERALQASDRFGGHFVSGHVDAAGKIAAVSPYENAYYVDISMPAAVLPYMSEKGSVAVDGISLTIFDVNDDKDTITLSLIPHTWQETTISDKQVGDPVNIEADMLMKYTERLLSARFGENISNPDKKA
ncbi:riboflavin synthase [Salibacterium qingdaonense]|uniref:Riboflavin synthase n=1 Tax=Salibacterium qingdaonense TaxID=266892 RepID=A0A1I4M856_9BACI|nr:riboflavin synthase [Salibacterium qingdaonense]SFL99316.1 riboflavin synthase alpha chain [Salibacterium qingdaonense]